ncbi:dihydropteroate synthase [Candidatus Bipolaricaulota bacterium]
MTQNNETANCEQRVLVMGILNVTPNSFYDGGRLSDANAAVEAGLSMIEDGADILDIGGESSRPGVEPISLRRELARILPVVEALRTLTTIPISVDTTKASVAESALKAGANIVNDISALRFDPAMAETISKAGAKVILMHMQGTPQTMQREPYYDDVVKEVHGFLMKRAGHAQAAGIPSERIILDPGIGFGKLLEHNLALLRRLPELAARGYPVLIGLSRKSFLGQLLGLPAPERLEGTIAANSIAILGGASIIRVHDVKEGRRTADVAARLRT